MVQKKELSDNQMLYETVGHLVSMHREGVLNDFDLYNSILRLIHFGPGANKNDLQNIVDWLDREESNNTPPQEQYLADNVLKNAGEQYFEGLQRLMPLHNPR